MKKNAQLNTLKQRINLYVNKGEIKKFTKQMLEQGPINGFISART